jgi:hypothetical protein
MDLIQEISIKDSNFVTINQKEVPRVSLKSSAFLNAIIEVDDYQADNKELEQFQQRRKETAARTNFKPNISSFGDTTPAQKSQLITIIEKYKLAFSMDDSDIGQLAYLRFSLPLHDETLSAHEPPRKIPIHIQEKVQSEVNQWLDLGIVSPAQSAFNIPLLILQKPDKSIRISLDARQLNKLLISDRFPIPHLSTMFTRIGQKLTKGQECFFSQVDFSRGYWQIRVTDSDSKKLAFSFNSKHYCSNRMLYGTSTAPAAFSRIMQRLFSHENILIYLDDVIILNSNFEDHVRTLEFVFKTCEENGLLLNRKKIVLCKSSTEFLGHRITRDGITMTDKHIKCIRDLEPPTDRQSLKRLLGLINYNAKYCKDASLILSPLYKLTSSKVDFVWTDEHQASFETIKSKLLEKPALGHFKTGAPLTLVADASGKTIGGCLYQDHGTSEFTTLGYFSRPLNKTDSRRSMREKELIGLMESIRYFEYYLYGVEFTAVTDHKSLLYLYKEHAKKTLDLRLATIQHFLQNFNFKIIHRPGNDPIMYTADTLSRLPSSHSSLLEKEAEGYEEESDTIFMLTKTEDSTICFSYENRFWTYQQMAELQANCPATKNLIIKARRQNSRKFTLIKDVLFAHNRLVLPENLSSEFLQYLHVLTAHCGCKALLNLVKRFYIHKVQDRARSITSSCATCVRIKPQPKLRPSMIRNRFFESTPFTKCHIDLIDFGRPDANSKRYLLTCIDELTSYLDGEPLHSKTDSMVSRGLLKLILRHGINGIIISDNGREFGPLCKEIMKKFDINHVTTSAYNSGSNGKVERSHRDIEKFIKTLGGNNRNWSLKWPEACYFMNNLGRATLDSLSPNECVFGRSFHVPWKIDPITQQREPFVKALNEYLKELYPSLLRNHMDRYKKLVQKDTNSAPVLPKGTKVLTFKPDHQSGKLGIHWDGPFFVKDRMSKDSYILMCPETHRIYRRHIRHIRPLKTFDEKEVKAKMITDEKEESLKSSKVEDDEVQKSLVEKCEDQKDQTDLQILFEDKNNWADRLRQRPRKCLS